MSFTYREVAIEDDLSVGDSGTLTVDLNIKDPITALIVRFKVKNDGATVPNLPPEVHITRVEIVDGGQTYWSLNGQMAVAAAVYGLGRWPHHWYHEQATANQRINFPLLFGRYIGDEEFAFDPSKLLNPQLKITWTDQALYLDDNHQIGITARVMEGLPSPAQCLMWKEIEAWTSAASGTHKVDLPTDYPYRSLMMRAYEAENIISNVWDHFKMECDLGKYIPFDLDMHEFKDITKQEDGPFQLLKFDRLVANEVYDAWMGETLNVMATGPATNYSINAYSAFWSHYWNLAWKTDTLAVYENATVQNMVVGYYPHNSILYRFGRRNDLETWFPSTQYGEIALKIDESDADFAASVAVQQPRRLP